MQVILRLFSHPLLLLLSILGATIGFFIGPAFATAAIIGFAVNFLATALKNKKIVAINWTVYPIILLYAVTCITAFWSQDTSFAIRKIILYLPLFILPFAIQQHSKFIQTSYPASVFLNGFLCFLFGMIGVEFLVYTEFFSVVIWRGEGYPLAFHHIRYGMILLLLGITSWHYFHQSHPIFINLLWIILGIALHFTSVRSAWLGYYILSVYPLTVYLKIYFKPKQLKFVIPILLSVFGLGLYIAYLISPAIQHKIGYTLWEYGYQSNQLENLSDKQRIVSAQLAWDFMKQHPLGTGVGDFKTDFAQYTQERGIQLKKDFLPHSQSLILGLIGGFPLCIASLIAFLAPLAYAIQKRKLYLGVVASFCFLLLNVEPLLDTQAGLIPFILFLSLGGVLSERKRTAYVRTAY